MRADRKRHDYYVRVAEALVECQLVEFELRFYVGNALELLTKGTKMPMPVRMLDKEITKARRGLKRAALGKLTEYFSKLSNAPDLVSRIEAFRKERNHIAHVALAACIDPDGELDHGMVEKLSPRIAAAKKDAKRIIGEINTAGMSLVVHLYLLPEDTPTRAGK